MKRSLNRASPLHLLIVPGFLFLVLSFLLSRVSAQTPELNLGEGVNGVPPVAAAPGPSGDVPSPVPARPARWFQSNAGGMALRETSTRFAALSSEYALLIDYALPRDLPPALSAYYRNQYYIEVHVLYRRGAESRRQWIFRDERGTARLVSVLNEPKDEPVEAAPPPDENSGGDDPSPQTAPTGRAPWGFIELYNENYRITEERAFADDGTETVIEYAYRGGLLIRAEGRREAVVEGTETAVKTFTDDYRYNRSSSLRVVERLYHEDAEAVPIRLEFPNRVLDMAAEDDFITERLAMDFEFFGETEMKSGYRMMFTTDERGRILTQTLLDDKDEAVWRIENTWSGNRLVSALKTEGDELRLIEFEYDSGGDRIIERNMRNGVLERLVRAEGGMDVEELYMEGEVILRALWEDGRKISETRIRRDSRRDLQRGLRG